LRIFWRDGADSAVRAATIVMDAETGERSHEVTHAPSLRELRYRRHGVDRPWRIDR